MHASVPTDMSHPINHMHSSCESAASSDLGARSPAHKTDAERPLRPKPPAAIELGKSKGASGSIPAT